MRAQRTIQRGGDQTVEEERTRTAGTVLRWCAVVALLFGLYALTGISTTPYTVWSDNASIDIVRADGTLEHYDQNMFPLTEKGDVVYVNVDLPQDQFIDNAALVFKVYHSEVTVTYGGQVLYEHGQDIQATGQMIGADWPIIDIPNEAWGSSITIEIDVQENSNFSRIDTLEMYSQHDAMGYFFNHGLSALLVTLASLLIAVALLVGLLFTGKLNVEAHQSMCIALFAIIMATWLFSSFGLFNLFAYSQIWSQLEFMSIIIVPLPILLYAQVFEGNKTWRWIFRVASSIVGLFFTVVTILNFTNVMHYCDVLIPSHLLTLVSAILVFVFAVRHVKEGDAAGKYLLIGIACMMLFAALDVLRFNTSKFMPWFNHDFTQSVLPIGMMIFLVFLVMSHYTRITDRRRDAMQRAFDERVLSDAVTQVPNGICVADNDRRATIVSANDYFYALFGYTKDEALRIGFDYLLFPFGEIESNRFAAVRPKAQAGEEDSALAVPDPDHWEYELRGRRKDGKPVYLSIRSRMSNDGRGHVISSLVDVTERNEAQRRLAMSESSYRAAAELTNRYIIRYDLQRDRAICMFDSETAFGLPRVIEHATDRAELRSLLGPDGCQTLYHLHDEMIAGNNRGRIALHVQDDSPTSNAGRWFELTYILVDAGRGYDGEESRISAVTVLSDVTEIRDHELAYKRLEESLAARHESIVASWECNLSTGMVERMMPETRTTSASVTLPSTMAQAAQAIASTAILEPYRERFLDFVDVERLKRQYSVGNASESITVCATVEGKDSYFNLNCQSVLDPYGGDVKCFMVIENVDDEKAHEMQMEKRMEELQQELENSRIKVMINQMQPHFLYNALSAIRTITKVSPDYAYDLLYDFTVHLRSSIKALQSDDPIPFSDELKNVKAYLNIEKMRFSNLRVDYEIDCSDFKITPLSIQPLAENAARHGVYPKGGDGGTVTIRSYETFDAYVVEVEDDGMGFDVDAVLNTDSDSVGLKNMIFRMKNLMDADVEIDSTIGKGTLARVSIPKKDALDDASANEGEPDQPENATGGTNA